MRYDFFDLFNTSKPVITVLHGRGRSDNEVLENAKRETEIFIDHGVDAVLVENYFCTSEQAEMILEYAASLRGQILVGINLLGSDERTFALARKYDCDLMQLDSVSGHLAPGDDLSFGEFISEQRAQTRAKLIGGVRFKYQPYNSGRSLKEDMDIGRRRCDALAVTQDLTGQETSMDKIREFRALLGDFPLVIAAGLTVENLAEQLALGDACIVGSYFKENHDVERPVNSAHVGAFMAKVRELREVLV